MDEPGHPFTTINTFFCPVKRKKTGFFFFGNPLRKEAKKTKRINRNNSLKDKRTATIATTTKQNDNSNTRKMECAQ